MKFSDSLVFALVCECLSSIIWLATRCLSQSSTSSSRVSNGLKRLSNRQIGNRLKRLINGLNSSRVSNRMKRLRVDKAGAGSAHSWRARTSRITVRNCLLSTKDKVTDDVVDRHNECWWGQWWRLIHGHDSEYEIVNGLWSSCPTKGVANPTGIRWVNRKWKDELFKNSIQTYVQYLK
jgi:hypothetical protein